MSDVALARGLIQEIAGHCWTGKGDMIDRVYDAVVERYPHWTRRRVRAFFHREAALVKWHEMNELAEVARVEAARRDAERQARLEHTEFIERATRLASALAVQDEEFHREAIDAFGRLARQGDDLAVEQLASRGHGGAAQSRGESRALGAGASA